MGVGSGVGTGELGCKLRTNDLLDLGTVRVYFVLEDDLADYDGNGGAEVADEAECCCCCSNVPWVDLGLKCDYYIILVIVTERVETWTN